MDILQELSDIINRTKDVRERVDYLRSGVGDFLSAHPELTEFADDFIKLSNKYMDAAASLNDALGYLYNLESLIANLANYTKEFDLYPGDWVRITLPTGEWFEGTVDDAHWYRIEGWYIEIDKRKGSSVYMEPGYGYWRQDVDGGTVEKIENPFSQLF